MLRRHVGLVVLAMFVTAGVAVLAASTRPPLYEGRVEIVVQSPASTVRTLLRPANRALAASRLVPTELRVLTSQEVRALATSHLGFAAAVTARQIGQTDVIEVAANAATPQRAFAVARAYAEAYIELRRTGASDDLLATSREVDAELARLRPQIDGATGAVRAALQDRYSLFADVRAQLEVDAVSTLDRARLLTPASGATARVRPDLAVIAGWAAIVGAVLGVDLVLLFHFLDQSVRSRTDVEGAAHGVPVLGEIRDGAALAAEDYRSLQAVVLASCHERPLRIQVTGAGPDEGTTTTVANLGMALAEAGHTVVLVDAHLRRPILHERFRSDNDIGLTSVAAGAAALRDALQDPPGLGRLRLLAAGPLPLRGAGLPSSPRLATLLEGTAAMADIVVIDSPPVLEGADALVLARVVDATLLVVRSGRTSRRAVARAVERLLQVDATLAGVILNGGEGSAESVVRTLRPVRSGRADG